MKSLTATEVARKMSDVLDAVEDGERFVIVRHGRVVARLEPTTAGTGRAAKELLRRTSRDDDWLEELRELRTTIRIEDRDWDD